MPLKQRNFISSFVFSCVAWNGAMATAQMGGMPGGGGGDNAPAFSDPKFIDKLYEAGGRAGRQATDGSTIVSVRIEGNKTISENFILSTMQSREDRSFDKETSIAISAPSIEPISFAKSAPTFPKPQKGSISG